MLLSEIASRLGLQAEGGDVAIERVALADDACPGSLCLVLNAEYAARAEASRCSAVLAPPNVQTSLPCLRAENARVAFARVLALFDRRPVAPAGVHPRAVVHGTVDPSASVAANAVVEEGAHIGPRTRIGAGCYVGADTRIGEDCVLAPNVVVMDDCTLGNRVRLASGVVIGAEGFGYEWDGHEHVRVPHLGMVVLEDDVDIGANSCVDRAKTGETRVGQGTKIDNLVQVGHGVAVGPLCLMAAQVGIAGHARIGAGAILAGQVGVADGVHVGDGAIVAAQSAVTNDVAAGGTYMGYPARDVAEARRIIAAQVRTPGMLARLRDLERRFREE